jgi:hypothetical protein
MQDSERLPVDRLDEERKGLLRRILECQAYRQRMAGNIRGHGLKYVMDLDAKVALVRDVEYGVGVLREVERLHARLGGEDLGEVVRAKMERIPYPMSKLELAACLTLTDRAEQTAAASYADSVSADLAAIARTVLATDRSATRRGEQLFVEFCAEASNRPHAQQMFDRWLAIALRSLGRPGTRRDQRAVELGLRTQRVADSVREFLAGVGELAARCGLAIPPAETLAVELPAGATA